MKHVVPLESNARLWPNAWRMALIAVCTLILCSCRAPVGSRHAAARQQETVGDSLPTEAYTGGPAATLISVSPNQPGAEQAAVAAQEPHGPWSPPGIRQPWPEDEYLRDGGDQGRPVGVSGKREVLGLGMEDTVAHYDTLDGRTVVEPSNEVHIYSPRFGAVRQVVGLVANEEHQRAGGVREPMQLATPVKTQIAAGVKQNIPIDDKISARPAIVMRTKQGQGAMSSAIPLRAFQNAFKAYENLAIIRKGVFEGSETAFLARGANAAVAWSHDQAVQVILDRKGANAAVTYDQSQSVYRVDEPPGNPKLRLVKVASTGSAKVGETVDFTLRFDNVGNQPLGHVTILDSLNTRLEFLPDGAQCSIDANVSTQPNEGGSVVVRCELSKPLEPGQGGILRFRCRVR